MVRRMMSQTGFLGVPFLALEAGVNLIGCQMTVDLFGFKHEDFIPEVKEYCGAASFLGIAKDADVSLFI